MLNGAYEVPADVIRVIAGKKLHIEFVADSLKSWLTDGAKISAVTAADLSVIRAAPTEAHCAAYPAPISGYPAQKSRQT